MRSVLVLVVFASCSGTELVRHDASQGDGPREDVGALADGAVDAPDADGAIIDAGPGLPNTSGTRLELRWVEFDANRTSPTIYDSARAEPCEKQMWTDGQFYCTPLARVRPILNDYDRYADSQCQTPMAVDVGGDYAAIASQTCGGENVEQRIDHLYRLGAPVTTYYERRPDGSCVGPFEDDFFLSQPATEIARSELAPLAREVDPEPGRLAHIWLTSTDGLRLEDGVHDRQLGVECAFEAEEQLATSARCVPKVQARSLRYFANATCTRPAIIDDGCTQPSRARETLDTRTRCALEPEPIRAVGSPVTTKFELDTSPPYACKPNTVSQWVFRELGDEVQLAQAARERDATGPRVTTIRHVFEGRAFHDRRLYDRELDMECVPDRAFGDLRCVDPNWSVKHGYSDATCATPIDLLPVLRGPASCAIPKTGAHVAGTAQDLYSVGALYTGKFYEKPWTTCVERDLGSVHAHLRLTAVSPTILAPGTVVIDP